MEKETGVQIRSKPWASKQGRAIGLLTVITILALLYALWNTVEVRQTLQDSLENSELIVQLQSAVDDSTRILLALAGLGTAILLFVWMLYHISRDSQMRLSRLASTDGVTGGMNNAAFRERYRQAVRNQQLSKHAVVLLNVRHFKLLNEKLGFGIGNDILRRIMQELSRHLDDAQGEFAARSEMDNFFFCLNESAPDRLQARILELESDIDQQMNADYPGIHLAFTAGCCVAEDDSVDIRLLQDRTRIAMREDALAARTGCAFYSADIAARFKREQEMESSFDTSLANGEFQVYLQPKVDLKSGQLRGAEALVRWIHPALGFISPGDFIPLFERSEKICQLDFYVFEEVCRFYQRRTAEGKCWVPVSVNLSRRHFYEEDFLDAFQALRRRYGIPDQAIEFELTESMFFDQEQNERIQKGIERIHQMGFRCSMDDFGAGYSSLGILKEFDVDTLKLDKSFFQDMDSEKARDIVRSVVELAAKLHLETVAEGIEQPEQMDFLQSIHCDVVQGYFFSKPLPIDEFESWAARYETALTKA